jgi:hypothetical protein
MIAKPASGEDAKRKFGGSAEKAIELTSGDLRRPIRLGGALPVQPRVKPKRKPGEQQSPGGERRIEPPAREGATR